MKYFFIFALFSTALWAKEFEVQMKSISFEPKTLEIAAGDTVKWNNISYTDHSATGESFDTGLVKSKAYSKPVVFSKAGSFSYNCKVHGKTMSGTIVVGDK
jgi:plastocyanin